MDHEEKVINGVLHHRSTPNGQFVPYSLESLTTAFLSMQSLYQETSKEMDKLKNRLTAINIAATNYLIQYDENGQPIQYAEPYIKKLNKIKQINDKNQV